MMAGSEKTPNNDIEIKQIDLIKSRDAIAVLLDNNRYEILNIMREGKPLDTGEAEGEKIDSPFARYLFTAKELAERSGLKHTAVYHHLKELKEHDLIREIKFGGRETYYYRSALWYIIRFDPDRKSVNDVEAEEPDDVAVLNVESKRKAQFFADAFIPNFSSLSEEKKDLLEDLFLKRENMRMLMETKLAKYYKGHKTPGADIPEILALAQEVLLVNDPKYVKILSQIRELLPSIE